MMEEEAAREAVERLFRSSTPAPHHKLLREHGRTEREGSYYRRRVSTAVPKALARLPSFITPRTPRSLLTRSEQQGTMKRPLRSSQESSSSPHAIVARRSSFNVQPLRALPALQGA
jgi:hypothetical protein